MAEIMVGKTGESIQTEDVEKHVLALIRALRILNRNDERSVKLLQEINFLSLPEQGETSDEVKKIKKQPVLSQKDEGEQ